MNKTNMITINFTDDQGTDGGKEFLVGLDDFEQLEDNSIQFVFDGVENAWFQDFGDQSIRQVYEKITPNLFIGRTKGEFLENFNKIYLSGVLSRWFLIVIVDYKTDLEVTTYIENAANPESTVKYIKSISGLGANNPTAIKLNNFFSWSSFSFADSKELLQALDIDPTLLTDPHKLNVYNVGQGSLCSITTEDNLPLIYFDMGGGAWRYHSTYPNPKQLCFTKAKTIVLSHWDWDHLETARRYSYGNWAQFNQKTWIVPKQNLTSSYFKLACMIANTGNMLIWPDVGLPSLTFWGGEIILCNGPHKNHSGLALIVDSPRNSIPSVLHPADAAYRYILGATTRNFDGVVATHHGANFPVNNTPVTTTSHGHIAYSHGNGYGHPTAFSLTAHAIARWTNIRETTNGSISFTTSHAKLNAPCFAQCDLGIAQTF